MVVVVVAAAAVVVIVAIAVVVARRRPTDAVDSFRRQIDALSPEARRPVVERVQELEPDDDAGEPDEGSADGP